MKRLFFFLLFGAMCADVFGYAHVDVTAYNGMGSNCLVYLSYFPQGGTQWYSLGSSNIANGGTWTFDGYNWGNYGTVKFKASVGAVNGPEVTRSITNGQYYDVQCYVGAAPAGAPAVYTNTPCTTNNSAMTTQFTLWYGACSNGIMVEMYGRTLQPWEVWCVPISDTNANACWSFQKWNPIEQIWQEQNSGGLVQDTSITNGASSGGPSGGGTSTTNPDIASNINPSTNAPPTTNALAAERQGINALLNQNADIGGKIVDALGRINVTISNNAAPATDLGPLTNLLGQIRHNQTNQPTGAIDNANSTTNWSGNYSSASNAMASAGVFAAADTLSSGWTAPAFTPPESTPDFTMSFAGQTINLDPSAGQFAPFVNLIYYGTLVCAYLAFGLSMAKLFWDLCLQQGRVQTGGVPNLYTQVGARIFGIGGEAGTNLAGVLLAIAVALIFITGWAAFLVWAFNTLGTAFVHSSAFQSYLGAFNDKAYYLLTKFLPIGTIFSLACTRITAHFTVGKILLIAQAATRMLLGK